MSLDRILSGMEISASGLAGERLRMEVAANNIANAHSTRTPDGGPYRRQVVTFSAAMDQFAKANGTPMASGLGGVRVVGVKSDQSKLPTVYDPGHPDADDSGHVQMPNVVLPHEMIDLVTAGRAYEANLKSMEMFRQMAEQSLSLLQSLR